MSTSVKRNKKVEVKLLIRDLDVSSRYALVFSARKGISYNLFTDFASTIDMKEQKLHPL